MGLLVVLLAHGLSVALAAGINGLHVVIDSTAVTSAKLNAMAKPFSNILVPFFIAPPYPFSSPGNITKAGTRSYFLPGSTEVTALTGLSKIAVMDIVIAVTTITVTGQTDLFLHRL